MEDVKNGIDLGLQHNWDNDPCRKIVDQKYLVTVEYEKGTEGLSNELIRESEILRTLGFEIDASVQLSAQKEYSSPLQCLNFVRTAEKSGFKPKITERRFSATNDPYWKELTVEDLEKILRGEMEPAYKLTGGYNPDFSPKVDIGD